MACTTALASANDSKASHSPACPCALTTLGRTSTQPPGCEAARCHAPAGQGVCSEEPGRATAASQFITMSHMACHSLPEQAACHSRQHFHCLPAQHQCLTAGRALPCSPTHPAGCAHLLGYCELAIFLALQDAGTFVVGYLLFGSSTYAAQVVTGEASMLCRRAAWSAKPSISNVPVGKTAAACHSCRDAPMHS